MPKKSRIARIQIEVVFITPGDLHQAYLVINARIVPGAAAVGSWSPSDGDFLDFRDHLAWSALKSSPAQAALGKLGVVLTSRKESETPRA